MSSKLFKNRKLTIYWYSFLFILIFLPSILASVQQANQTSNLEDKQFEIISTGRIRKQRNSFIKDELNHQNSHHTHKYYSSLPFLSNYRSSGSSIYLNEETQSDAYIPYRSLHNHSLLTASLDALDSSSFLSASSSSILQQQINSRKKLSHLPFASTVGGLALQGPSFQMNLPPKISFSNNTGLVLNCAVNGYPTPVVSWQTESGISVLVPTQTGSFNNNENSKYLQSNLPLVHHHPTTNALVFRPFTSNEFSPEVHSTKYRCLASNSHGTITSPFVQIRAGNNF